MHPGQNVLADPQFSVATILRPFDNFEDVYAGQPAGVPVAFFPPGPNGRPQALDPDAGARGVDENLLRYVPVPLGAQIVLYIPHALVLQDSLVVPVLETLYTYTVHWRVRNLSASTRRMRTGGEVKPYHSATFEGRPDTTAPATAQARVLIPSATRTVLVEQPEPATTAQQVQHLRRERFTPTTSYLDSSGLPLLPSGAQGVHMQGVLDPGAFTAFEQIARSSLFMPIEFTCEGDEMLITANRYDAWEAQPDAWSFTGLDAPDAPFSNVYGRNVAGPEQPLSHGLGIYMFMGA